VKERLSALINKLKFRKKEQASDTSPAPKKGRKSVVLLLAIVLGLIVVGGAGLKVTSSDYFCTSCHEMQPENLTFQVTSHSRFSCTTCHVTPGVGNYIQEKFKVMGYIGKHFTKKSTQPIVSSAPIPNQVCESCHSSMRKVTASGDINIPHDKHLQHDIACTACHGGVAHAFVAERGLTTKENLATWTLAKAQQVSIFDDTKTAMEGCMDCHDQVNQGKEPWLDNQGLGKTEAQLVTDRQATEKQAKEGNGDLPQAVQTTASVGTSGLTAPMRCAVCHKAIQTPVNHVDKSWANTHGITAAIDVKWCASCHSRQRERALVTAQTDVKDYARTNTLCAPCHEKRPESHLATKQLWLPTHSKVLKDKGAPTCLVCHEITKATNQNDKKIPGVNAVTCNTCHWFKNGKVQ